MHKRQNISNWFWFKPISVIYLVFKAFSVRMHRVVHSNIFTLLHFKTCLGNSHIKSFLTDVTNCLPLMDLYIQYCFKHNLPRVLSNCWVRNSIHSGVLLEQLDSLKSLKQSWMNFWFYRPRYIHLRFITFNQMFMTWRKQTCSTKTWTNAFVVVSSHNAFFCIDHLYWKIAGIWSRTMLVSLIESSVWLLYSINIPTSATI